MIVYFTVVGVVAHVLLALALMGFAILSFMAAAMSDAPGSHGSGLKELAAFLLGVGIIGGLIAWWLL